MREDPGIPIATTQRRASDRGESKGTFEELRHVTPGIQNYYDTIVIGIHYLDAQNL